MTPREHLLRLVAPVATGTTVVHIGCRDGALTADLAALGLDVWACDDDADAVRATRVRIARDDAEVRVTRAAADALGYPDGYAPWVALSAAHAEDASAALAEAARVVALGGWIWVEASDAADLLGLVLPPDVMPVEVPKPLVGGAACLFRRVGEGVVG